MPIANEDLAVKRSRKAGEHGFDAEGRYARNGENLSATDIPAAKSGESVHDTEADFAPRNGDTSIDADAVRAKSGEIVHDTEANFASRNGECGRDTDGQPCRNGEGGLVTETEPAQEEVDKQKRRKKRKRVDEGCVTESAVDSLCRDLQSLERQRRFALKQCIRGENAITAFVAWNACGFHTGIPSEAEREKLWKKAGKLIKDIDSGEVAVDADARCAANGEDSIVTDARNASDDGHSVTEEADVSGVVRISQISRKAWNDYEAALVAQMKELAGQLRVAPWLETKECRGISLGFLATIVGEAGNLSNYPNPAKLWKRLFGAPYTKNGVTKMPSRWRLEKGLSAEEWEEIGYSPQRHATMQQLKENIVRQNLIRDKETKEVIWVGPFRKRYDEARERTRVTHPEWWVCSKCDGKGKVGKKKCQICKGTGEVTMHAHRHAQLLAAKRFVRELWNRWHGVEFDAENEGVPQESI